jgi:hypothetical protein
MTATQASSRPAAAGAARLAALLAAWFAAILGLSLAGAFQAPPGTPPVLVAAAAAAPLAAFGALYAASAGLRAYVLALDLRVLVLLHTWRMAGLGFVFLYFQERLPGLFALPAGLGDALAAIGALVLGVALYRGPVSRGWVAAWNGYGLADFVVALGVGVLAGEPALAALTGGASMAPMQQFPQVLIPAFAVPVLAITHLIVFLQLRNRWKGAGEVDLRRARD